MPRTIKSVVDEISAILPPDMYAWLDPNPMRDAILVGNSRMSFAVTRQDIDDNFHMAIVRGMIPHFHELTELHRTLSNNISHDYASPHQS